MALKFDVPLIIAVVAVGALWLEHEHRRVIDAPDEAAVAAVPACPENDNVPYTARCLEFLKGATSAGMRWRINATDSAAAAEPARD